MAAPEKNKSSASAGDCRGVKKNDQGVRKKKVKHAALILKKRKKVPRIKSHSCGGLHNCGLK